jgi:Bax protein
VLFLRTMLPLIVQANDRSLALRSEVESIDRALADGGALAPELADGMARLLGEFRLDGWDRVELLRRADMVPPSLALAQAATESGWGSSSFAREGNALFGQREFARTEQSPDRKVPRLRRFDDLAAAVAAYVRNLNTHPAYAEFRNARAALRAGGQAPSGARLVSYLVRYSEQGSVYTRYIQGIMRSNDLAAFDRTQLRRAASEIAIDYPDALTKPRLQ